MLLSSQNLGAVLRAQRRAAGFHPGRFGATRWLSQANHRFHRGRAKRAESYADGRTLRAGQRACDRGSEG